MGAFSDSVKANSAKILGTVNDQCYDIAFYLFNSVINLTPSPAHPGPFAKGYLVNQWFVAEGAGNFSSEISGAFSPDGTDSRDRINNLYGALFDGKDGVVTLTNNTPYVMLAERDGWTWTEPYRMVAMSMQATVANFK